MNVDFHNHNTGFFETKNPCQHQLLTAVNGSHLFTAPEEAQFQPNNVTPAFFTCPSELSRS